MKKLGKKATETNEKPKKTKKKSSAASLSALLTTLSVLLGLAIVIIFFQNLEIQSSHGKHNAMVETYDTLSTSIGNMLSIIRSKDSTNDELDRKNLSLREQIALYEQDVAVMELKIAVLEEQLAQYEEDMDSLGGSKAVIIERIEDYENEILKLQEAAEQLNAAASGATLYSESYSRMGIKWNLIENYTSKKSNGVYSTPKIPVDASYYYAIYSPETVSVVCYSKNHSTLRTLKEDASDGWFFTLEDDVAYVIVKYASEECILVSTGINRDKPTVPAKGSNFYVVGANSPVDLSMSSAVNRITGGGTVLVFPGTYTDNVSATTKKINLIGVDKTKCILQSYSMDYFKPPIEAAAGTIKNLTIRAVNKKSKEAELKAYAIHIDYDYTTTRGITIQNCNISSDFNSALGIGLRTGNITISDCELTGLEYGLFFHDSVASEVIGGKQSITVTNCKIKGTTGKYAMAVESNEIKGNEVTVIFKNNTLSNPNATSGSSLITAINSATKKDYDGYWLGLKNFKLDSSSKGNNVSALNH